MDRNSKLISESQPFTNRPPQRVETIKGELKSSEEKLAKELPFWKLYLDFETRKMQLQSGCRYIRFNRSDIDDVVERLGMTHSDFDAMSPEELRTRTDLPTEVVDFFLCVKKVLEDDAILDIQWTELKRRGSTALSGLTSVFGFLGVSSHDKID